MVFAMCLFTVTIAIAEGLRQTPAELVDLARALDASRLRTFWAIRLPAALPQIFVGVNTALPLAVIGAVVAELFGGADGLGYVIANAGTDADLAFAAIALLAAISITLHGLATGAQALLAPWIRHTTR
jgi:NitT/TauT family transport system permease protein